MRLALGQLEVVWENKEENQQRCRKMIAEAKAKGAELIFFPEMTLTGFSMDTEGYGEPITNSPSIDFFRTEARENEIAIGFGLIIKNNGTAENHCLVVDAKGEILADYAKIHPFTYGSENRYYTGGKQLAFCEVNGIALSPLICYDLRFPEIFQACSAKSSLITVIANWPQQRRAHWISLLQARAIENQCFIAGINRCGEGGGMTYCGDSMLISPYGDILAHAHDGETLLVADIEEALVKKYRQEFPLKADRKPDLYSKFYKD